MTDLISGEAQPAAAAALPEDEFQLVLRKPVEFGGVTYDVFALREPTAAQWELFDKLTGVEADVQAVSAVAGVPAAAVRKIGVRDLIIASKYLGQFLGNGLSSGGAS